MTEVGHMSSVEAAERFIEELRRFLHEGVNGHYPGMVPAGSPPKSSASSSDSPCGSSSRASGRRSGSPRRSGPRRASPDIAVEIGAVLPFSMARRHHDQPVQRERGQATTRGWVAVADAAGHPWP